MKYNVHVYAVVRVKVHDVEADSQIEACRKAEKSLDLNAMFNRGEDQEFADEISHFLVDDVGDTEFAKSRFYDAVEIPS